LKPDEDFLGTRTLKIIASNEFGIAESNFFNITMSEFVAGPELIKEIPTIYIEKDSFSTISINDYFEDAEQFFLLQVKNISSTTFDHTIRLQPDVNFVGERKIKIIAVNDLGSTESNFFDVVVGEEIIEVPVPEVLPNISITTTQFQAVIGKPVKWRKDVSLDIPANVTIKLPADSSNITVKKIEKGQKEDITLTTSKVTGQVIAEGEGKGLLTRLFRNIFRVFTGQVIAEIEGNITQEIEVEIDDTATKYEIEYETPAPSIASEIEIERGKRVVISGPETIHYENVLTFTNLPESFNIRNPEKVRIYWVENDTFIPVQAIEDKNENGIYDYIEWIVPQLSNQTFDIIVITKAEHLDSNRTFISDIFEEVKELDNIWSETIPDTHYVRATFEINLTSGNDITIFPRTINGNPRIEVYEVNQDVLIAEFDSLEDNEYNKVFLTNLQGSQDTFDLRVLDGDVEFDHIVDPTLQQYYLIGASSTGGGTNGTLETTRGDTTAYWVTTADNQFYTWIKQYTSATVISNDTAIVVGFYCNATSTQSGDRVQVEELFVYDCGTSATCATQEATICSVATANINCDQVAVEFNTISCTGAANRTLDANDYLGIRLMADIQDNKNPDLILNFNSTTRDTHVNISEGTPSSNAAPQITNVFSDGTLGGALNEGPSSTSFTVNFSVVDTDGASDLDSGTAAVNFSKTGEDERYNVTCAQYQAVGNAANYTCNNIQMWWWDGDGTWNINASITDSASNNADNGTNTFSVSATTGFVQAPGNLTFAGITAGGNNFTSDNDPLLFNNTGNQDVSTGTISINATNLLGEENGALGLYSGNFSVGNTTGGNAECGEVTATTLNYTVSGGSYVNITTSVMNASNFTINNGQEGQERLYFCLRLAGSELTQQSYSTKANGPWTIQIVSLAIWIKVLFLEGIGSGILLVAVITRKRKKRKTARKKSIKDNKLIIGELSIPVSILSKKLGVLEALVKYMKENLNLDYHEIAKLLNRNDRTIWTVYKKASEKQQEPIEVKKTLVFLPVSILRNRKLTTLEAIVIYLKAKEMRYSEIAELLDRDQRNIWSIYSRATKKLYREE